MSRYASEPNTLNNNSRQQTRRSFLSSNPVMRRLNKVDEYSETNACTYGGIALKTAVFMLFSVAGIIVQRILQPMLSTGDPHTVTINNFETIVYVPELIAIGAAAVLGLIFQLLAFFARGTTPVTGALYCVTQGYFVSFLLFKVLEPYGMSYLGALALAITMIIILVMAILYTTGVIRVTKKFRMVMLTLIITSVALSVVMLIMSFIPFTQPIVAAVSGNLWLSIGVSAIFIIIAALFLICDFDTIDRAVTEKLPKKYEWQAAFGLSFTVLWLYLKVLDIIMSVAGSKRS